MRSTMLMPVEWAVVRIADTAKLTALADSLQHDPYYYVALRSSINLDSMSCIQSWHNYSHCIV